MKRVINHARCSQCGSSQTRVRLQRNQLVCYQCGFVEDLATEEKVEEEKE